MDKIIYFYFAIYILMVFDNFHYGQRLLLSKSWCNLRDKGFELAKLFYQAETVAAPPHHVNTTYIRPLLVVSAFVTITHALKTC